MENIAKRAYLQHKERRKKDNITEDYLKKYYILWNAYGICAMAEEMLYRALKRDDGLRTEDR